MCGRLAQGASARTPRTQGAKGLTRGQRDKVPVEATIGGPHAYWHWEVMAQ